MLILLPPSEGKRHGGHQDGEVVSVSFQKPYDIATSATQKELKCTGSRYTEGIELNRMVETGPWMSAIDRYDGVMYRAIDYSNLSKEGKEYFDTHVRILSGMYGILHPHDQIANYKLPTSTRLKHYRKESLTDHLNIVESDLIIDLLPGSYCAMIDRSRLTARVVSVERHRPDGTKVSHGVKGLKGRRLHDLCEQSITDDQRHGGVLIHHVG